MCLTHSEKIPLGVGNRHRCWFPCVACRAQRQRVVGYSIVLNNLNNESWRCQWVVPEGERTRCLTTGWVLEDWWKKTCCLPWCPRTNLARSSKHERSCQTNNTTTHIHILRIAKQSPSLQHKNQLQLALSAQSKSSKVCKCFLEVQEKCQPLNRFPDNCLFADLKRQCFASKSCRSLCFAESNMHTSTSHDHILQHATEEESIFNMPGVLLKCPHLLICLSCGRRKVQCQTMECRLESVSNQRNRAKTHLECSRWVPFQMKQLAHCKLPHQAERKELISCKYLCQF